MDKWEMVMHGRVVTYMRAWRMDMENSYGYE